MSVGLGFSLLLLSLKIFCCEITAGNEISDTILLDNKYIWVTEPIVTLFRFYALFHICSLGSNYKEVPLLNHYLKVSAISPLWNFQWGFLTSYPLNVSSVVIWAKVKFPVGILLLMWSNCYCMYLNLINKSWYPNLLGISTFSII